MTEHEGHTEGPWEAVPLAEGKMWGVVANLGGPGRTFITVTMLDYVPPDVAMSEANARLMADAPNLLAENRALRAALRTMRAAAQEALAEFDGERWYACVNLLRAMGGEMPNFRPDITAALALIEPAGEEGR